jgi:hypothetical protein
MMGSQDMDELIQKARWRPKAKMTRIARGTKKVSIRFSECQNKGCVSITFNRDSSCAQIANIRSGSNTWNNASNFPNGLNKRMPWSWHIQVAVGIDAMHYSSGRKLRERESSTNRR